ncbi:3-deoxy-7-phosphoheptulonate synthase [Streptomyces sp. NPDC002785]|uniref:3-deoxy-7-phosphoheptulonate synthase n=1 Tax=Streptomyces sp. NPDC002785 TaxID=3154543 RepID=UPI003328B481
MSSDDATRPGYSATIRRPPRRCGSSACRAGPLSEVHNPVAVRIGPGTRPDTVLGLVDRLDPHREPGRLTFVVRAGADRVRDLLPVLVEKVRAEAPWAAG